MGVELLGHVKSALSYTLFQLGGRAFTAATLLTLLLVIAATLAISRSLQNAVARGFARKHFTDEGTLAATQRLLHYVVLLVGVGVALETAGVDLSALFAAGAVFAVAIGFAMQTIMQNFVSGVILLFERAIKPGDVLVVDGVLLKVSQLGIRSTVARTRDDEDLIIPNSVLVGGTVRNLTFRDPQYRLRVVVGVSYGSDMEVVKDALRAVGEAHPDRLDIDPRLQLVGFGASSVDWELSIWTSDPWTWPQQASAIRQAIWDEFLRRRITIAFPQLDVHFEPAVSDGLRRLGAA